MEKIIKKEVVRLLTENKSCMLCCGLKRNTWSIEDYFDKCKNIQIEESDVIRTAKAKGYRLVFSNDSVLDLSNYVNNEESVAEFYKDGNIVLLYNMHRAGFNSNFDCEHIIIYAIV